jgi:hypothetical protein
MSVLRNSVVATIIVGVLMSVLRNSVVATIIVGGSYPLANSLGSYLAHLLCLLIVELCLSQYFRNSVIAIIVGALRFVVTQMGHSLSEVTHPPTIRVCP